MYDLGKLKRMVETSADLTSEAREGSEKGRDYYDCYQYTAEETAILHRRKQPIITVNRVKRKIDAMVGIEQRSRVDPRALPRNPGDEQAADLATKALCFVEETQRLDEKRSSAFENLLVEGYGGVDVCAEPIRGQMEPAIKRLRWEEIFFDPFSREKDFSDAGYIGVMKWMALDQAAAFVGKFYQGEDLEDLLDVSSPATEQGETYEDRPAKEAGLQWVDKKQKRVRFAQMYYRVGDTWMLAIFNGKGVFYNDQSPYLDEHGAPACSMILMTAYIDRENRRYGMMRDLIPLQDEVNKRRSKLLHQLNSRQTMGIKGSVDVAATKRQLALPDGHVEFDAAYAEGNIKPFEIISQTDQIQGQFNLLQESKSEIDMLGPNASLLGQLEGQQSGRAIMAQQNAGMAELAPIYDSLRDWTERVYRAIWARIKQFWTEPRWVRITEETEAPQFIGLNQPTMGPQGPVMMNPVAEIDVDIIIDQAPEYATLRAEQFEKLAELAQSGFPIPPRVIIEASDLRDKRKILEMMEGDPQAAAMQQQLQQRGAEAEIATKETQAEKNKASAMKDLASIGQLQAQAAKTEMETRIMPIDRLMTHTQEPRRQG